MGRNFLARLARWVVAIVVLVVLVGGPFVLIAHQSDVDKLRTSEHENRALIVRLAADETQIRLLVARQAESRRTLCRDANVKWSALHLLFSSLPPQPGTNLTLRAMFLTIIAPTNCDLIPKVAP